MSKYIFFILIIFILLSAELKAAGWVTISRTVVVTKSLVTLFSFHYDTKRLGNL